MTRRCELCGAPSGAAAICDDCRAALRAWQRSCELAEFLRQAGCTEAESAAYRRVLGVKTCRPR